MFLQTKTAVGKVKTGPYLILFKWSVYNMYQSIPKLPIPPGKPKHNASSKGDLIEPTKAVQGKKGGTHKNP